MTNEELDHARATEAARIAGVGCNPAIQAARLAREGWTPPVAVDPDKAEAITLAKGFGIAHYIPVLEGIKRGRALAAEAQPGMVWVTHDGSVESPAPMGAYVFIKGKRNGQVWTEKEIWAEKAKYVFWEHVTHYAIITQPEEK
jgi:hypothetical protein